LARAILEKSPHALLCGEGAEDFARTCHLKLVENSYFDDEYRYNQLLKAKQEKTIVRDHDISVEKPMGTVGAVALDSHGNLAASTSTGGTTNKSVGRIGDTPLIGAGNYANNATCAVSCTGFGEEFMRKVAAHDLHSRMIYGGLSLTEAANAVVSKLIDPGTGGLIAIDRDGDIAMPFNTPGMFRGYKRSSDDLFLSIWE
jgi:beta-aspartyl-peptidase (threonine type)